MTQKLLTVKEVGEILDLKPARIYELYREDKNSLCPGRQRQYRFSKFSLKCGLKTAETVNKER